MKRTGEDYRSIEKKHVHRRVENSDPKREIPEKKYKRGKTEEPSFRRSDPSAASHLALSLSLYILHRTCWPTCLPTLCSRCACRAWRARGSTRAGCTRAGSQRRVRWCSSPTVSACSTCADSRRAAPAPAPAPAGSSARAWWPAWYAPCSPSCWPCSPSSSGGES